MNRVAICALVGVLCFYGAAAQCAPPTYNTGFSLVENWAGEEGRFAVDFTTNQLAANTTRVDNTGTISNGTFVFNNGAAWWFQPEFKTCIPVSNPTLSFFSQCYNPEGIITSITIAGVASSLYKYETPNNATAILHTADPHLPVSFMFYSFGGPSNSGSSALPYIQTVTYFDAAVGADPSMFVVPDFCQANAEPKAFEDLPNHRSIKALLMMH